MWNWIDKFSKSGSHRLHPGGMGSRKLFKLLQPHQIPALQGRGQTCKCDRLALHLGKVVKKKSQMFVHSGHGLSYTKLVHRHATQTEGNKYFK